MGEIVNLRLVRKRKTRVAEKERAEENRRLHGRSKGEKARERAERLNSDAFLDGHKREQFQQKCAAVLRPELRKNKEIDHLRDSKENGNDLKHPDRDRK